MKLTHFHKPSYGMMNGITNICQNFLSLVSWALTVGEIGCNFFPLKKFFLFIFYFIFM